MGRLLERLAAGAWRRRCGGGALELLERAGRNELLTFRLDHDYGWDDGLICGGIMDIQVDVLEGAAAGERFAAVAAAIAEGRETTFSFEYVTKETRTTLQTYTETIAPTPTLLIAGVGTWDSAGALAGELGFHLAVIDDRPEYASAERFPKAVRRIVGEIDLELARYPVTEHTYVVIVTRGHRHDGRALGAVVRSPARYVGLIGSKKKVRTIMADLAAEGVPRELLYRVHAPIGLEIGAVTVPEIAVSIAAELIAVRYAGWKGGRRGRCGWGGRNWMRGWIAGRSKAGRINARP